MGKPKDVVDGKKIYPPKAAGGWTKRIEIRFSTYFGSAEKSKLERVEVVGWDRALVLFFTQQLLHVAS